MDLEGITNHGTAYLLLRLEKNNKISSEDARENLDGSDSERFPLLNRNIRRTPRQSRFLKSINKFVTKFSFEPEGYWSQRKKDTFQELNGFGRVLE